MNTSANRTPTLPLPKPREGVTVPEIDIDEVVASLQRQIVERRLAGDYPAGLEKQLESEFAGLLRAVDRHEIDTNQLEALVQGVVIVSHDMHLDGSMTSRLPGGASAHRAVSRIVQRHKNPLAESIRDLGVSVADALWEVRRLLEAQRSADERQLLDAVSGVLDRLAVLDHLAAIVTELEERVALLESERSRQ